MSNQFKYTYYVLKVKGIDMYFNNMTSYFYTDKTVDELINRKLEVFCNIRNAMIWLKERSMPNLYNSYDDMIIFLGSRSYFKDIFDVCEVEETIIYNVKELKDVSIR